MATNFNRKQLQAGAFPDAFVDDILDRGVRDFQRASGVLVDGKAGAATLAAFGARPGAAVLPSSHKPVLFPTGKGIYIRRLAALGPPGHLVQQAKDLGLSFVVIGALWQHDPGMVKRTRSFNSDADLIKYSEAFWAAGIHVHVWGYPQPGLEAEFVAGMDRAAELCRADTILIDPEKPYRKQHQRAQELVDLLDDLSRPFGVTSYGSAWNFKDFPYATFAKGAAYGSPQVYDIKNEFGPGHARKAYDSYKAHGYSPVLMSGPLYNKTDAQFNALLGTFPKEAAGIIFWDWANLVMRKNKHLYLSVKYL